MNWWKLLVGIALFWAFILCSVTSPGLSALLVGGWVGASIFILHCVQNQRREPNRYLYRKITINRSARDLPPYPGDYPPRLITPVRHQQQFTQNERLSAVDTRSCRNGGPCKIGHRRAVYALDGVTRVASYCTHCRQGTPWPAFVEGR